MTKHVNINAGDCNTMANVIHTVETIDAMVVDVAKFKMCQKAQYQLITMARQLKHLHATLSTWQESIDDRMQTQLDALPVPVPLIRRRISVRREHKRTFRTERGANSFADRNRERLEDMSETLNAANGIYTVSGWCTRRTADSLGMEPINTDNEKRTD